MGVSQEKYIRDMDMDLAFDELRARSEEIPALDDYHLGEIEGWFACALKELKEAKHSLSKVRQHMKELSWK